MVYTQRHSQLYDIIYSAKPYAAEAEFVHKCLNRYSEHSVRRLLELACGTGRHAIELAKHGYELIATDYSPFMLARAQENAASASIALRFEQQDMRSLEVGGRPFDAAICLFDSIGHVHTNAAISQVLEGVHKHLRPGGLFIFEFWHASAMLRGYEPVRVGRWPLADGELLRISETQLDCASQIGKVKYSLYELRGNGTYSSIEEEVSNRYFLVQEMASYLAAAEFAPVGWFNGYSFEGGVGLDTWHVVAIARRN